MADQDRRGDDRQQHDHAWAELTWRMLVGFVFKYGFIPGTFVGGGMVAAYAYTNWWSLLGIAIGESIIQYWWIWLGFALFTFGFFYLNHRLKRR